MPPAWLAICGEADQTASKVNRMSVPHDRVFPVPLWILSLCMLALEFTLLAALVLAVAPSRPRVTILILLTVSLSLAVRALLAITAYRLSRWKGMIIPADLRMTRPQWLRYFAVEYFHLCMQSLVLIPLRPLFRTASERGKGPPSGPVILLQHGYAHNGGVWFFTARALERSGYRVFTMDQPLFASIDTMGDRLGDRISAVLSQTQAAQLTLVAHSMGGLVCRAYLRRHGGQFVDRLITLGSPHNGTFHAVLAHGVNGSQMRLGNAWLAELAKTQVQIPFWSLYSVHDTLIAPQDSSAMQGAENILLSAIGHVSMPSGRDTRAALLQVLPPTAGVSR